LRGLRRRSSPALDPGSGGSRLGRRELGCAGRWQWACRREQGCSRRREQGRVCGGMARAGASSARERARAGGSIARAVNIYASRREQGSREQARAGRASWREQGDLLLRLSARSRGFKGDLGSRKGFEGAFRPLVARGLRRTYVGRLAQPGCAAPSGIHSPLKKLAGPARALGDSARAPLPPARALLAPAGACSRNQWTMVAPASALLAP
jgi:hypothetical protein